VDLRADLARTLVTIGQDERAWPAVARAEQHASASGAVGQAALAGVPVPKVATVRR
jgi:hypothetical protein